MSSSSSSSSRVVVVVVVVIVVVVTAVAAVPVSVFTRLSVFDFRKEYILHVMSVLLFVLCVFFQKGRYRNHATTSPTSALNQLIAVIPFANAGTATNQTIPTTPVSWILRRPMQRIALRIRTVMMITVR